MSADYSRPVPRSWGKWQWSQQNIVDHYQDRGESGSGRGKTLSTSTKIAGKVAVVATKHCQPLPEAAGKWQWSQQNAIYLAAMEGDFVAGLRYPWPLAAGLWEQLSVHRISSTAGTSSAISRKVSGQTASGQRFANPRFTEKSLYNFFLIQEGATLLISPLFP